MNLQNKNTIYNRLKKHFWGQHPESALRYAPVISEIEKIKIPNAKILEIGSGSLGITPYLKQNIDAVDVDFSGPPSPYIKKIKGKAWSLPFAKNSYDITISVDVLEHIPPQLREKSIFEMIRVTNNLAVIVVPTSQESESQDKDLQAHWNKTFKIKNQFLDEHVKYGLPQSENILVYIDRSKRLLGKDLKVRSYPNLNLAIRNILMRTWISNNRYLYYLYLKGFLPLVPLLKFANFGKTYRRVFVIEFARPEVTKFKSYTHSTEKAKNKFKRGRK